MPQVLRTTPDVREFSVALGVFLLDGFTGGAALAGPVVVRLAGWPRAPLEKPAQAVFAFFDLPAGDYVVQVRSDPDSPYYQDADIPVTLPFPDPRWPAFPDVTHANPNLPADDPGQTAEFLAERKQATLLPTTAYPFPAGATLVRGTVRAGGAPLAGATVTGSFDVQTDPGTTVTRQALPYLTGRSGEYVLFFTGFAKGVQTVHVAASHPAYGAAPPQDVNVGFATTAAADFDLAP
jgi:hypothetical protein